MPTAYTKEAKPTTDYTREIVSSAFSFLLKEDGFYLLQEDGSKIIISGGASVQTLYVREHKPFTLYSKEAKP